MYLQFYTHIKSLIINILLISFVPLWAQEAVEDEAVELPADFRSEQIYLAPLRAAFTPGDTIAVDGVVTSLAANRVAPFSRYLFLELIDEGDIAVVRQKIRCDDDGFFHAAIPTDSVMPKGLYYLRAYTRLMRNFSMSGFAQLPLPLGYSVPTDPSPYSTDDMDCRVFAHGGALIPDIPQRLSAVAMTGAGVPMTGCTATLTSSAGDTVASAVVSRSGFATFSFIPRRDATYDVTFAADGLVKTVGGIEAVAEAVKIQGALSGRRVMMEIAGNLHRARGYDVYLYDRANGLSRIDMSAASASVSLANDPMLVTLFLADSTGSVLSQCHLAPAQPAPAWVLPDSVRAGEPVALPKSAAGDERIMARIVGIDAPWISHAEQSLIYTGELTSAIPFPQYLYLSAPEARTDDLQAWLGSASFSRFSLSDLIEQGTAIYSLMPEMQLEFSGAVYRDKKFTHHKGTVVAYDGSSYMAYEAPIAQSGQFTLPVDDFAEGTEFFLQYVNAAGKTVRADIRLPDETYPPVVIDRIKRPLDSRLKRSGVGLEMDEVAGSHKLPDVVVKARAISEAAETTRRFYGMRAKYREDIEKRNYLTLLDIIRDIPTVRVQRVGTATDSIQWKISNTRGAATLKGGADLPLIFDGSRWSEDMYDILLFMPASDIESVEYLSSGEALAYVPFALNGAILVTTKVLNSKPRPSKGTIYRPPGLTPPVKYTDITLRAPTLPGKYRLIVDAIGPDGIRSWEQEINVTP